MLASQWSAYVDISTRKVNDVYFVLLGIDMLKYFVTSLASENTKLLNPTMQWSSMIK